MDFINFMQTLIPEVVKSHIWEKDEVSSVLSKKELERLVYIIQIWYLFL